MCVLCHVQEVFRKSGKYAGLCKCCFYRTKNREYSEYRKQYYGLRLATDEAYRECIRTAKKRYRCTRKGRLTEARYKAMRRVGPGHEKDKKRQKQYYYENRQKRIANAKRWCRKHPERAREHARATYRKRKQNPIYNLGDRVRAALKYALKHRGLTKQGSSFELLGYTPVELHEHLVKYLGQPCVCCNIAVVSMESCHLDHKIPICTASSTEDVLQLNRLSNLRLICPKCNMMKGGRLE